jgi:hypothetical protein
VEATGNFHHKVMDSAFMEPDALLDHPNSLDATDRMLDANPSCCVSLICGLLLLG